MRRSPLRRSTTPLRRSPLNRVSRKGRKRERGWAALKAQAIEERGDVCEACKTHPDERCSGRADEAHHQAGRLVQRLDVLLLVGTWHHRLITREPELAYRSGWSLKRNQQPLALS